MNTKKALKLLKLANGVINEQLNAAGAGEVKQHPTLRRYDRLSNLISKFLKDEGGAR